MKQLISRKQHLLYPLVCWLVLVAYILIIPPVNRIAFTAFYLLLYAALYTSLLLRFPQKMAILWSGGACVYMLLRQLELDSVFTMLLFIGVLATLHMFLRLPTRRVKSRQTR